MANTRESKRCTQHLFLGVDFIFIQHCQLTNRLFLIRQTDVENNVTKTLSSYGSAGTHLRQYVDAFVAASEGQVENRAASIGHRRRLQLQHQIRAVRLRHWGLGVLLWTHHMEGLQEDKRGHWDQLWLATLKQSAETG